MAALGILFKAIGNIFTKKNTKNSRDYTSNSSGIEKSKRVKEIKSNELRDLLAEGKRLKSELNKLNESILSIKNESRSLNSEKSELNEELTELDSTKENLTLELTSANEEDKESIKVNLSNIAERKREVLIRIQDIDSELRDLELKYKSDRSLVSTLEQKLQSNKDNILDLKLEIEELDIEIEETKKENKRSLKERLREKDEAIREKMKALENFLDKAILWTILTPVILSLLKKGWDKFRKWAGSKICNIIYNLIKENSNKKGVRTDILNGLLTTIYMLTCKLFEQPYKSVESEVKQEMQEAADKVTYDKLDFEKDKTSIETNLNKNGTDVSGDKIVSSNSEVTSIYEGRESISPTPTEELKTTESYQKNIEEARTGKVSEDKVDSYAVGKERFKYLGLDRLLSKLKEFINSFKKNSSINNLNSGVPFLGYFLQNDDNLIAPLNSGYPDTFIYIYLTKVGDLLSNINPALNIVKYVFDDNLPIDKIQLTFIQLSNLTDEELKYYKKSITYFLSFPVKLDKKSGKIEVDKSIDYQKISVRTTSFESHTKDQEINQTETTKSSDINETESKEEKGPIPGVNIGDDLDIKVDREPHEVNDKESTPVYGKVYVNGKYFSDSYENGPLDQGTYRVAGSRKTGASVSPKASKATKTEHPWWYHMRESINSRFPQDMDGDYIPEIKTGGTGRSGIRIHPSNGTGTGSEGCLTVGKNIGNKFDEEESKKTWDKLMPYLHEAKEATVTYEDTVSSYPWNKSSKSNKVPKVESDAGDEVKSSLDTSIKVPKVESIEKVKSDAGNEIKSSLDTPIKVSKVEADKGSDNQKDEKDSDDRMSKKLDTIIKLQLQTFKQISILNLTPNSIPSAPSQGAPRVTSDFNDETHYKNLM